MSLILRFRGLIPVGKYKSFDQLTGKDRKCSKRFYNTDISKESFWKFTP